MRTALIALLLVAALGGCSQRAVGRATATAGALAVSGAAMSMADNSCYESNADDPTVRERTSFCNSTPPSSKFSGGSAAVLGIGVGAILAGKAIELNAKEDPMRRPSTALSGTLPGQAAPETSSTAETPTTEAADSAAPCSNAAPPTAAPPVATPPAGSQAPAASAQSPAPAPCPSTAAPPPQIGPTREAQAEALRKRTNRALQPAPTPKQ